MQQSVTSLFNLYCSCSDLAESSIAIKSRAVRWFVEWFGDIPVGRITYATAEDYKMLLVKGRSKNSANIYIRNIKPYFGWLVRRGYIEQNPFGELKLFTVGEARKENFSADEIERLLRVADNNWKVICLLGLSSLRRGEVLNLCVSDIHFDKSYILITPKKATEFTWRWDIKNHNQAIVPLPEFIELPDLRISFHKLLIELIENLPQRQPYVCLPPKYYYKNLQLRQEGRLTFEHRNCPRPNFTRSFKNLLKRAKVQPKRFHDLRGTFANKMIRSGCSLNETQKLMRHASSNTTAKYYLRVEEHELVAKSNKIISECYVS